MHAGTATLLCKTHFSTLDNFTRSLSNVRCELDHHQLVTDLRPSSQGRTCATSLWFSRVGKYMTSKLCFLYIHRIFI